MVQDDSGQAHLDLAIRNAIVLSVVTFIIGGLVGWALSQWARAPVGSLLGALIGTGYLVWLCRMYYATRGLL